MATAAQRLRRIYQAVFELSSHRLLGFGLAGRLTALDRTRSILETSPSFPADDQLDEKALPKLVFQSWKSRQDIPANYQYWRKSFSQHNPGFAFFVCDPAENRRLIEGRFPWFLPAYDTYPSEAYRTDIARYFVLYLFGGFYAHIDSQCLRPLESFRSRADVLLSRMGSDVEYEHSITNTIMASRPRQVFWLWTIALAMERLTDRSQALSPEWHTGPILLKASVDLYLKSSKREILDRIANASPEIAQLAASAGSGRVEILPSNMWCPINWNNPFHRILLRKMQKEKAVIDEASLSDLFPEAFVATYWSPPWT